MCSAPGNVTGPDLVRVGLRTFEEYAAYVGVLLDEASHPSTTQAESVLPDQHLGVAVHTRADADRRDGQLLGHLPGDVARNHLHHHCEGPGGLDGPGVVEQPLAGVATALDAVAAEGVLALRREPDVRHHRHSTLAEQLDLRHHLAAALELDRVCPALLHEPDRRVVGLLGGALVGAERKITDHQRALH